MTDNNHAKSPRPMIWPLAIAGLGILALALYTTRHAAKPDVTDESASAGAARHNEDNGAMATDLFEEMSRLEALGYLRGSKRLSPSISGITVFEADAVGQGLNLCTSGHDTSAFLADMDGRTLHTWRNSLDDGWPGDESGLPWRPAHFWRRVHLLPGGDLLVVFSGAGIMKVDRDSNVIWAKRNRAHHDLEVLDDGTIYVLTRKARVIARLHETQPILEDFFTELGPDGETRRQVSLIECFEGSEFANILAERPVRFGDIFHSNSIRQLDGRFAERHPAFAKGNLLISIRELDAIVIVDPAQAKVVWAITGPWEAQHDAQLLDSGTMLVFDNRGARSGSRVIEFDPLTMEQVWTFGSTPERRFSSGICGTNQRLGNGNTLITESNSGRALEVTPDGRVVWEFVNPHRIGTNDQFIATFLEVERIDAASVEDWLEIPASSP